MSARPKIPAPETAARDAVRTALDGEADRMRATPMPDFAGAVFRHKLEIVAELVAFLGKRLAPRLSVAAWAAELPPIDRAQIAARFRTAADASATAEPLYALGRALSRNGFEIEAKTACARAAAAATHPGARAHAFVVENALFELAVLERAAGAKAEARAHIARALRRIPSFGKDQPIAADILLDSGDLRAGLDAFGRAYVYGHRYPAELVLPDWTVRAPARNPRLTIKVILVALVWRLRAGVGIIRRRMGGG
jgi:tetratricopeptide (TPR) repeat protein